MGFGSRAHYNPVMTEFVVELPPAGAPLSSRVAPVQRRAEDGLDPEVAHVFGHRGRGEPGFGQCCAQALGSGRALSHEAEDLEEEPFEGQELGVGEPLPEGGA